MYIGECNRLQLCSVGWWRSGFGDRMSVRLNGSDSTRHRYFQTLHTTLEHGTSPTVRPKDYMPFIRKNFVFDWCLLPKSYIKFCSLQLLPSWAPFSNHPTCPLATIWSHTEATCLSSSQQGYDGLLQQTRCRQTRKIRNYTARCTKRRPRVYKCQNQDIRWLRGTANQGTDERRVDDRIDHKDLGEDDWCNRTSKLWALYALTSTWTGASLLLFVMPDRNQYILLLATKWLCWYITRTWSTNTISFLCSFLLLYVHKGRQSKRLLLLTSYLSSTAIDLSVSKSYSNCNCGLHVHCKGSLYDERRCLMKVF